MSADRKPIVMVTGNKNKLAEFKQILGQNFPREVSGKPGPSCSKLTRSLVNVSLKFQTLILQIHCYFLLKKCENPLHCKYTVIFC